VTEDIIIFGGNEVNPYGHIALVSSTNADEVHIIQQNVGLYTRDTLPITMGEDGKWYVEGNVLAWLRRKEK
jgi:surface antigen